MSNGVKIIEHLKLTTGSYSAISHEVIGTELGDYIVGDADGTAIYKSPGCFNAGCGYPASHFGDYEGGYSKDAPERSKADKIDGGAGDDTLIGLGYDDTITGGYGHDLIYGDDDIDETSGNDLLSGGYGNDTIFGGLGNDTIHGDAGDDFIYGGLGNDSLYGDDGNDYIVGGNADSRLDGGAGSDTIVAGSGSNQIWGNNSSLESDIDIVDYSSYESHDSSRPVLQIQYANITISGQRSLHVLKENNAIDTISLIDRIKLPDVGGIFVGNDEANKFWGGVGADSLYGGAGDDTIYGGSPIDGDTVDGANYIDGGDGNDLIYGGAGGAETILGGAGNDTIYGNGKTSSDDGGELIHGGDGNDSIFGGIGWEQVEGGAGADTMEDSDGEGIVIYVNSQTSVVFGLTDTLQNGKFVGNGYGAEGAPDLESAGDISLGYLNVEGSNFADVLAGNSQNNLMGGAAGNDTIYGNAGSDSVHGMAGDDIIYGGQGNDQLFGGAGRDELYGETGDDIFVFKAGDGWGYMIENADEGNDYLHIQNISALTLYKDGDHLLLAANNDADVMILWNMFTTPSGVEKIYLEAVNEWHNTSDLVAMFTNPASSTFGLREGQNQTGENPNLPIISLGVSGELSFDIALA